MGDKEPDLNVISKSIDSNLKSLGTSNVIIYLLGKNKSKDESTSPCEESDDGEELEEVRDDQEEC